MKNLAFVFIALLIGFASCKQTREVSRELTIRDSVRIVPVEREVLIPRYSVESPTVNVDSIVNMLKRGIKPDVISQTLIKEDPETKLKVGILIDHLGNLTAVCEQQEYRIKVLTEDVHYWRDQYETIIKERRPGFFAKLAEYTNVILITIAITGIAVIIFRLTRP